jgi:hypothetical protein
VHPLAVPSVDAEDLDWLIFGRAKPLRQSRVELGASPGLDIFAEPEGRSHL